MEAAGAVRLRQARGTLGIFLTALCAGSVAAILLLILGYVIREGGGALSVDFVTQLPHPVGVSGGGVANGIVGSGIIVGIATLIAVPIGALTAVYLTFFGRGSFAATVRFLSDVLSGIPSIAVGLFAYTILVAPMHHFSAFSASFAFAVLMLPVIISTAESAINGVSREIYEGALALGLSRYSAIVRVVLPSARSGIVTGIVLAIARVTGETAPLLFTAFGSQFWELNPNNPMAELSLQVFTYAISPYRSWHQQAWGGALILIAVVFLLNLGARIALRPARSG
ncbi:MAG TPA: phosphate ABC transporter permease PstA [Candidatus Binataceae bacterium]|nr:phosphate ABC transporter permease PstA [Candidatus Binataceae bacterium]